MQMSRKRFKNEDYEKCKKCVYEEGCDLEPSTCGYYKKKKRNDYV